MVSVLFPLAAQIRHLLQIYLFLRFLSTLIGRCFCGNSEYGSRIVSEIVSLLEEIKLLMTDIRKS
jgi:hypothetical protein